MIYLSLGAGVQSSALLVMSVLELHGCPKADVVIFADTGDEPQWVYDQLEALRTWGDGRMRIEVVSEGRLSESVIERHDGRRKPFAAIPVFTLGSDGRAAPLRRQCSREYKIQPIERKVRELLGYSKGQRVKHKAEALIGISLDEATRMKMSRTPWVTNRYPLVDAKMRRGDCLALLREHGLPEPRKSACVFCPYHDNRYWETLRTKYPEEFSKAEAFDVAVRDMTKSGARNPVFLHRSLRPLSEVDFTQGQRSLDFWFDNECEGVCGV